MALPAIRMRCLGVDRTRAATATVDAQYTAKFEVVTTDPVQALRFKTNPIELVTEDSTLLDDFIVNEEYDFTPAIVPPAP